MDSDLVLSSLRDKGYKTTRVRKAIVGIFSRADKPLSAGDIYSRLHSGNLRVNKTTVYRELQFLTSQKILIEVYLKPEEISYEPAGLTHHHHLVCEVCGSIDNVTNCLVKELEAEVLRKKGFKITKHSLEFYGTCSACRNA